MHVARASHTAFRSTLAVADANFARFEVPRWFAYA
jgi:hypothetical protein